VIRIRIRQQPFTASIDGLRLDSFEVGRVYEVGNLTAALLLAEGWAEPVAADQPEPARTPAAPVVVSRPARKADPNNPPNLIRENDPPYMDHLPPLIAATFGIKE
jgi:hypothetical protein